MQSYTVLIIIVAYFAILLLISYFVSRKSSGNDAFFRANKQSPWWVVAIGMIGTSISGVTFVSVPGMVRNSQFAYMQMVLGFFFGYLIIAYVLLPLYYRLNLTTIYTYLDKRFGRRSYKTGASFFLLSKIVGSAAKMYIVAIILQQLIFDFWNIPFYATVIITISMIWLYTKNSGIKAIVWTDLAQTIVLVLALVLILYQVVTKINSTHLFSDLLQSPHTKIFVFDDFSEKQFFWKHFLSGVFVPIVMTGLDQGLMQKNLTIRTLKDAQKNMLWYGASFVPLNLLFLTLGALVLMFAAQNGISLPEKSDEIMTVFASQYLGNGVLILFVLGMLATAFTSADDALTAVTTSFSVDILEVDKKEEAIAVKLRKKIHLVSAASFVLVVLLFKIINNDSIIDTIYTLVGYTYGPLLGLYAFGLFTKRKTNDKFVPYIAILSPVICYALSIISKKYWGYSFGYELLMLNGLITFVGLYLSTQVNKVNE